MNVIPEKTNCPVCNEIMKEKGRISSSNPFSIFASTQFLMQCPECNNVELVSSSFQEE